MRYRIQKGLVRESICGQNVLIATIEAREKCPYLTQLNDDSAFIWDMLAAGQDTDEMITAVIEKYGISKQEASEGLEQFLNEMQKKHFIEGEEV